MGLFCLCIFIPESLGKSCRNCVMKRWNPFLADTLNGFARAHFSKYPQVKHGYVTAILCEIEQTVRDRILAFHSHDNDPDEVGDGQVSEAFILKVATEEYTTLLEQRRQLIAKYITRAVETAIDHHFLPLIVEQELGDQGKQKKQENELPSLCHPCTGGNGTHLHRPIQTYLSDGESDDEASSTEEGSNSEEEEEAEVSSVAPPPQTRGFSKLHLECYGKHPPEMLRTLLAEHGLYLIARGSGVKASYMARLVYDRSTHLIHTWMMHKSQLPTMHARGYHDSHE